MNKPQKRESLFFPFCGPSGSGKSTICLEVSKRVPNLRLSVSTTTRAPRPGEKDGTSYFFVDQAEFQKRVSERKFLEHAEYLGNSYGTELRNVELAEKNGEDLVLDIDTQGVDELKKRFGSRVVTVFVFPPSFDVLRTRLSGRKAGSEAEKEGRLQRAREEIDVLRRPGFSDYLVVNGRLADAVNDAAALIVSERCRFARLDPAAAAAMFEE